MGVITITGLCTVAKEEDAKDVNYVEKRARLRSTVL